MPFGAAVKTQLCQAPVLKTGKNGLIPDFVIKTGNPADAER